MAHPVVHAESSARRFGGKPEAYQEIHDFMDSSKSVFPDNRHRALTHNSWFIFVVERVFGHTITVEIDCPKCRGTKWVDGDPCRRPCWACSVSSGDEFSGYTETATGKATKEVPVRYICEQHILEDFGGKYIPTAGDYLEGMEFQPWINNGVSGAPTSHRKLSREGATTRRRAITLD